MGLSLRWVSYSQSLLCTFPQRLYGSHRREETGRDCSGCLLGQDIRRLRQELPIAGLNLLSNHGLGEAEQLKELEPLTELNLDWKKLRL